MDLDWVGIVLSIGALSIFFLLLYCHATCFPDRLRRHTPPTLGPQAYTTIDPENPEAEAATTADNSVL